jgi:hypothetical protein
MEEFHTLRALSLHIFIYGKVQGKYSAIPGV